MNKKIISLILGCMCALLACGIAIQVRTIEGTGSTMSTNAKENELRDAVLKAKEKYDSLYANVENAESKYGYDYGGKEKMLDLSWYQKYKANVDTLISGFLWLGFLWLLFKRTAAIIQGGEMLAEYSHDFSQGRRDSNETKFQRYLRKD